MIKVVQNNLFNTEAEAIINTVNCVGVMGKGLALEFKKQYFGNYIAYKRACDAGQVKIGKMFVYKTESFFDPKYIINFPTKDHWKNPSKMEYIREGLDDLIEVIKTNNIKSIAIPPLGCGLGGLNWDEVKEMIIVKMQNLKYDTDIIICEYKTRTKDKNCCCSFER